MADFSVRSDAVDVDEIMRQIRARIREKRGADYTEAEVKQLASVKLEQFLDPRGLRSDLVEQFRLKVTSEAPKDEFTEAMLYETPRGWLRSVRRLLNPLLKLFFNPAAVSGALRKQTDVLLYEVIHNLVLELTRAGIEIHNLKMRVESLSSRVDFDERRARSLEGVVQYRQNVQQRPPSRPDLTDRQDQRPARPDQPSVSQPTRTEPVARPDQTSPSGQTARTDQPATTQDAAARPAQPVQPAQPGQPGHQGRPPQPGGPDSGESGDRRRRRRRRRRRPGQTLAESTGPAGAGSPGTGSQFAQPGSSAPASFGSGAAASSDADDDGPDDGASDQ